MANADSMEIEILPMAITSAVTRLTHSKCETGGEETLTDAPGWGTVVYFFISSVPGISEIGDMADCSAVCVLATKATYSGKITTITPMIKTRWLMASSMGRRSIMLAPPRR